MEFTKLPTDNFYIFLSLAGIILMTYFLNSYFKMKNAIDNKKNEIKKELAKRKRTIEYYKTKLVNTKAITFYKTRIIEKEFNINFNEYLLKEKSNVFALPDTAVNLEQREKFVSGYIEIKKLILDTERELIELDETIDIITIETDMLTSKNKEAGFLKQITYVFSFIGIILSITGFSLWFQKHQFYQDKLLKLNYQINEFQKKNFMYDDSIRLFNNRKIKDSIQQSDSTN